MAKTLIMFQGDTLPKLLGTFEDSDGDPAVADLSAYTLTGTLVNLLDSTTKALGGTFTVTDGAANQWQYAWVAADTATLAAGGYAVRVKATAVGGAFTRVHAATINLSAL